MDAEAVADLFEGLGPLRVKRMFGGAGVWRGDAMFALIADGTLYMKADDALAARYAAAGSTPFSYDTKTGRRVLTSYWRLPDAALDDPEAALDWARASLAPAEAAAARRKPRRRRG